MIEAQQSGDKPHFNERHGHCKNRGMTSTYITWGHMIARCHNPKSDNFKWYGAIGIAVCDRWRNSFDAFLFDMGERPERMSIGRKNQSGNYEPENCKWETQKEQCNNRCSNRIITVNGESSTLMQWAERTGLKRECIAMRIRRGWAAERAVQTPRRHACE